MGLCGERLGEALRSLNCFNTAAMWELVCSIAATKYNIIPNSVQRVGVWVHKSKMLDLASSLAFQLPRVSYRQSTDGAGF